MPKTYTFTREVKAWGVEAGDYYDEKRHMYQGGTEKLLKEGVIKEEKRLERLTCESCGNTLGYLSNTCSNNTCSMYDESQKGVMKAYKN